MAGKYTAYHVYQDLSFTEANRAATQPYTLPEYHCAHSQRGYLFQFDSMAQRNHFDAATTTCCDEPVLNFQNKPQFAARSNPMRPRDCTPKAQVTGCQALEVSIEDSGAMCASQSARIRRIRIKCPSVCAEFAQIRNGGVIKSRFGTFRSLGMEAEEILILDYTPDPKIVDNVFKTCSGVTTFTEEFCDGHSLTFEVRGGLDFPGDCGCDCCGDLGAFPPPNMNLFAPDVMDGGPQNELTPNITITGDPACKGGEINGIFHGIFGSTELSWPGGVIYNSNGSDRRISRDQPSVGDAANPACCGGEIEWVATDGCGVIKRQTTMINAHVHDISVTPADGAILYENDGYSFVGFGACSYSNAADLNIETACLENGQTALYRIDSALVRNIDSTLRFENSHACSGCCGNGAVNLSFANGCGSFMTASYPVRRPLSQS
ncbi:MAG: hypothetical protein ACP5VS_11160, partial [Desulfomonilaceae bacterium]